MRPRAGLQVQSALKCCWYLVTRAAISRPLVDFGSRQPVGVGDVTSGFVLVQRGRDVAAGAGARYGGSLAEIMIATKTMQGTNCRSWRRGQDALKLNIAGATRL